MRFSSPTHNGEGAISRNRGTYEAVDESTQSVNDRVREEVQNEVRVDEHRYDTSAHPLFVQRLSSTSVLVAALLQTEDDGVRAHHRLGMEGESVVREHQNIYPTVKQRPSWTQRRAQPQPQPHSTNADHWRAHTHTHCNIEKRER